MVTLSDFPEAQILYRVFSRQPSIAFNHLSYDKVSSSLSNTPVASLCALARHAHGIHKASAVFQNKSDQQRGQRIRSLTWGAVLLLIPPKLTPTAPIETYLCLASSLFDK